MNWSLLLSAVEEFGAHPRRRDLRLDVGQQPRGNVRHHCARTQPLRPGYLCVIEPRIVGSQALVDGQPAVAAAQLRPLFKGLSIAAGGFEKESLRRSSRAAMRTWWRSAGTVLPTPIWSGAPGNDWPLNPHDRDTFYGGAARGCTGYPFHDEAAIAA
jgi:N-ethylmaleimide reductase